MTLSPHGKGGFQWSDIYPNWQQWTTEQYIETLNYPIAVPIHKATIEELIKHFKINYK